MTVPSVSPRGGRGSAPGRSSPDRPVEPGHDFSAPLDQIHADCLAQQRIIHARFDREAESIRLRGDQFAADIEALVAGADGWGAALRLAEQEHG